MLELFRVIDWMMALPKELAASFDQSLEEYEEERSMPYITSIERHGIEKGLQQGRLQALQEAVVEALQARFPRVPGALRDQIVAIEDAARLKELHRSAVVAGDIEEFRRSLDRPTGA